MQIDIEKLASAYGERAMANGRYTLSQGDYIMSPDDLKRYTAGVLEEAAKVCDAKHANGCRKYTHSDECAEAIRDISRQITEGKP